MSAEMENVANGDTLLLVFVKLTFTWLFFDIQICKNTSPQKGYSSNHLLTCLSRTQQPMTLKCIMTMVLLSLSLFYIGKIRLYKFCWSFGNLNTCCLMLCQSYICMMLCKAHWYGTSNGIMVSKYCWVLWISLVNMIRSTHLTYVISFCAVYCELPIKILMRCMWGEIIWTAVQNEYKNQCFSQSQYNVYTISPILLNHGKHWLYLVFWHLIMT